MRILETLKRIRHKDEDDVPVSQKRRSKERFVDAAEEQEHPIDIGLRVSVLESQVTMLFSRNVFLTDSVNELIRMLKSHPDFSKKMKKVEEIADAERNAKPKH
jgi:hypothetical protein